IIRAKASLTGEHEIVSQGQRYPFDAAIIATGSVAALPRINGLDPSWEGVWTSNEILPNTRLPKSLAVIGMGAVGLEFALRYARLGSKVTMLARSQILPEFPQQFGDRIKSIYEGEGIRVLTHRRPTQIMRNQDGGFVIETEGSETMAPIVAERLMLA